MAKQRPKRRQQHPTIPALVQAHFPDVDEDARDELTLVVYRFSLGFLPGNAFNSELIRFKRHLGGMDTDKTQRMTDFRVRCQHSFYINALFWRAMILYVASTPFEAIVKGFPVHHGDLRLCVELMSNDDYFAVHEMYGTRSIRMFSREDYDWLVQRAVSRCAAVYHRKLRYLGKYDQGIDLEKDLLCDALRVIHRYSHYPDRNRIWGSVNTSIGTAAERLRAYHQAAKRAAIIKLPAYRCPCCKTEWEHRKNKGLTNFADAQDKDWQIDEDTCTIDSLFCDKCSTPKKPVEVDALENEREYMATTVSISPTPGADGETVTIDNEDEDARRGDDAAADSEFVEQLHKRLSPDQQAFMHIYLGEDEDFGRWLEKQGAGRVNRHDTLAALVCQYLDLDWTKMRRELGALLGEPRAYLVECDGETDVVFAEDASHAVHYVAQHYRYPSGSAMQRDAGRIRVREYVELGPALQHLQPELGKVYSVDELPEV